MSDLFPNLCQLINCHQFDEVFGWASGTAGTQGMLPATSGTFTTAQQTTFADGSPAVAKVTVYAGTL
jgi:hypothetical protein